MVTSLSRPTLSGTQILSPQYNVMDAGIHNTILLLGHAKPDVPKLHRVIDMKEAIAYLKNDYSSPLVRALLEVYNAGGKDIWIYPVAPMNEYVVNPAQRLEEVGDSGFNFYELYYNRLAAAYEIFKYWETFEIVVPVEAPFYDTGGVDFCGQLATFCEQRFLTTGIVATGVLGTRVPNLTHTDRMVTDYNATVVQELANDSRLLTIGPKGKFVTVIVGEGVFQHPQAAPVYNRSFEAVVAALISTTPLNRAIMGMMLPNVVNTAMLEFRNDQVEALAQAKLNTVIKTARGRRGFPFQIKLATDNTLGETGTDFWSLSQMRVVSAVSNEIAELGYNYIGSSSELFKQAVKNYLDGLKISKLIVNYSLKITMASPYKAVVDVGISPLFGVRNISFVVETGPGA